MAYVGFSDNGYEYLNMGKNVLFSSDSTHKHLFDYITKDLSCLPELFEKYVSDRMDTTTFELKDCENSNTDINTIIEILKPIHPYFEYEYKKDIQNKIGNYFNKLLFYTISHQNKKLKDNATQENWYFERLDVLIPPFLRDDTYNDFFYTFIKWIGRELEGEECLDPGVFSKKPAGFIDEIMTQKTIYNLLYFILDISAPSIGNLKTPQRAWLYGNIFNSISPVAHVTQNLSFTPPIHFRDDEDRSQEVDYLNKIYDIFTPLYALNKLDAGYDNVPTDILDDFNSAIEYAKMITDAKVYIEYEVNSLQELLCLEIMSMIQSGTMIRKCKNCGKYFVVSNRKIAYCDRITESGYRCSAVGPTQSFQRKMNDDEALKIYNRAYKAHHARYRNGVISKEELSLWCSKGKEKLNEVRSGNLSIANFQEWLKK